ncbi:MAG: beta-ketoacyl-[acyl-carrier-protein] synthase II [Anaeromyxobacter sp. RBG_16_69_14]|nr:MAG: beta-ketoacyl-[acyl-carrier-protein] synthase II [Anaeromyxobacter sp. RBG_16_69_14]HJW74425.1 beta-ketoacyl-ACP synthase [Thermoleophilia bacterium]
MRDHPSQRAYPLTAYAAGNCLGRTTDEIVRALSAGASALRPCPLQLPFDTACGVFPGVLEPLPLSLAAYDSRLSRIALAVLDGLAGAVDRAIRRWGRDRVGVVVGTSTGGILESERAERAHAESGVLPPTFNFDRQHAFHGILEVIRLRTGAGGPACVISTACSSSGKVLGSARRMMAAGLADAVIAGGVDSLCHTTLRGFASLQALSTRACRPFSAERDGTSIGEGGAFLLLERGGDAAVRLLGVGESSDAHHMSHPHPEGLGARLAMEEALRQAGLEPGAVDHVNAHGTGTPASDVAEAKAIAAVVGTRTPVTSTKGYSGHLLGAAGATEAVFAALSIEHAFVPESLGAAPVDPLITVDVCLRRRQGRLTAVLSNSLAFGGSNVSVLLGGTA